MTHTSPDTPALRGLLESLKVLLTVPDPVHAGDRPAKYAARDTRASLALDILTGLLAGPIDNCAIQNAGHMLLLLDGDLRVGYDHEGRAA